MLIGIDPLLHADLLHTLRAMGHNDTIVIADGNFPATKLAQRLLRVDGASAPAVLRAVLSVMPVDAAEGAVVLMRTDAADGHDPVTHELADVVARPAGLLPPARFYEEAAKAFAIVQTGERRFFGNALIRKGVVPPAPPPQTVPTGQ